MLMCRHFQNTNATDDEEHKVNLIVKYRGVIICLPQMLEANSV
jgi:hypothetical protein